MPNVSTLISVDSFGTLGTLDSLFGAFFGATNLVSVPSTLPTSVTKIPQTFQGATKFNDPDVALWDTSRITNMTGTFADAASFNQNLSSWSLAAVTSVGNMFNGATAFNNGCATGVFTCPLTWSTPNLVATLEAFKNTLKFNQNLNSWSMTKVVNTTGMFSYSGFNNGCVDGDTSCPMNWTFPLATNFTSFFLGAPIFNQNVTSFLSGPNNATSFYAMFRESPKFNNGTDDPPINTWQTGKVTTFKEMFNGGGSMAFNRHIEGWSMASALDLSWMFRGATAFNNGCAKGVRTCPLTWSNTGKVTTINSFANYGNSSGSAVMSFDQSINSWDITSMTDFSASFGWSVFNNGGEPFWPGKTVKTGAIMNRMFAVNPWFNVPVGGLNVSGVKNMSSMFTYATGFNQDLSGWQVSGLTNQQCCFPSEHSMQNFFASVPFAAHGISVTNYEKWLNSLTTDGGATTYVPAGTIMNMGNSKYTCNAEAVRAALATKFTLTDGGKAPLPPPTINSITPGDGFLDVAFSAPKCFGVAQSPSFYYYSRDNGATWVYFAAPSPASADGTVRISGNNGQTYPVRLRAYLGGQGDGAPSDAVNGTPVGPIGLDAVVTIADKTYDGTTRATITGCQLRVRGTSPAQFITDPTIASCDVSAATATFAFSHARPASAWAVTTVGASLTGPRASEYRLQATPPSTAKINPAPLAVVPSNVEVIAGTAANAVVYPYVLSGWVNGETAATYTITAPTCTAPAYTDAMIASDPAVTISCTGGTLVNTVPSNIFSNYTLVRTATAQLSVASGPPPVTVQATITASDREYDATRNASIACEISGGDPSDTLSCDVSGLTAQFDTKNVGNSKTVTATGITLSVNTNNSGKTYVLAGTSWTATASITPKSVTPAITVNDKVYDRTKSATIATCTLTGVIVSEAAVVTCDKTGALAEFDTAAAGTGKTVTASGLILSGNSNGNYVATSDGASTTASITRRPVEVKALADTKVYDGTTASDAVPIAGLLPGQITNATQSFDAADASDARTLSVDVLCASVTITDNAEDVTSSYVISCDFTSAIGVITPAPVTISPVAESRAYDGTASSSGTPNITGLFGSDAIDATQVFDSPNGGDRDLEITSFSFTSGDPANYIVDDSPTVKGQISAVGPIRVKATSVAYGFDGSTPTLGYSATGFMGDDDFVIEPQCKVFATTDLTYITPITNFATITPNSYIVHCFNGDAGTNYTGIEYDDGSFQPQGTATYTGPRLVYAKTGTPSASVTLSATVDPATVDCYVLFSLYDADDTDTPTYEFGPFGASSGAVATTQIVAVGVYTVEITAFGNCYGRSDDVLSVVPAEVGRGSVGGGFYRNINDITPPRVNLGYEVQVRTSSKNGVTTTTTKGQVLWMAKVGWRVKASINYSSIDGTTKWTRIACPSKPNDWPSITRPTCGQIQGSGVLQRLDPDTLTWETYDAAITFTMTVYDGGQVTTCKLKSSCRTTLYPDFVGMTIWASDGSQILPGTVTPGIPTSEPVRLANGQTRIF
jgi:hypothetical protein